MQPRLVVVMGDDALAFVNELAFPLSRALEEKQGELQRFTPTIEALVVPDIDSRSTSRPRRRASGTPSSRSGPGGPHCRRTSARSRRSSRGTSSPPSRCDGAVALAEHPADRARADAGDVPARLARAAALARARWLLPAALALAPRRGSSLGTLDLPIRVELLQARGADVLRRGGSSASSRSSRGSCSSRC